MGRPLSIHFPDAIFHIINRGNNKQTIFEDDFDREKFIAILVRNLDRFQAKALACCLMTNHFHLAIQVSQFPIWIVMQCILTSYAKYFNRRHERIGHLFQDRYKPILCDRDEYLLELVRYIHRNPVKAGMVKDPADWPWSSHNDYLGKPRFSWIHPELALSLFHPHIPTARKLYAEFVLMPETVSSAEFEAYSFEERATPQAMEGIKTISKIPIKAIIRQVEEETRVPQGAICGGSRLKTIVAARRLVIQKAISNGFRNGEIAQELNCSIALISKVAISQANP